MPKVKFKINKPENFKLSASGIKNFDYNNILKKLSEGRIHIFLLIGIIILLNYFSMSYFIRVDTTDSQLYSISDATKKIINELNENVTIEVYFSNNIPPNLSESKQNVLDLLEEYSKASGGKIVLDIKDPEASDFESNALSKGIRQIQFSEFGQDKFSVAQGFLGIAFVKGDDTDSIPVVASLDNLEYEATSRIVKLSASQDSKIGFYSKFAKPSEIEGEEALPQQNQSVFDNLNTIKSVLDRQYTTEEIDLSKGKPIDVDEYPVLVVISSQDALDERELFELDQYVLKGGNLFVLEDLLKFESNTPVLNKTASNLNNLLSNYGITVEAKVLLDESFTPIISGLDQIAYPYWVLATEEGINKSIPPLTTLEAATFLWSNPLTKESKSDLEYTELISTTNLAWTESGEVINIDFREFVPSDQKKYTIGYLVEGKVESAYKGKEIPVLIDTSLTDERTADDVRLESSEKIRLVVIGDSDFISDGFINANEQNPVLFLNIVDWLSNSNDLSTIRSKSVATRPLNAIENDEKNIYKAVNSAAAPVLITLLGIGYIRRRRRQPSQI